VGRERQEEEEEEEDWPIKVKKIKILNSLGLRNEVAMPCNIIF
jgi:hypothetical protein